MDRINKIVFFWLFVLGCTSLTNGQSYLDQYKKIIKSSKSIANQKQEVNKILNALKNKKEYDLAAEISHLYLLKLNGLRDYKGVLDYTLFEIEAFELSNTKSEKYANALYNAGRMYFRFAEYDKMIEYYNKVISSNISTIKTTQSYAGLGRYYGVIGDYYREIEVYKKCINHIKKEKNYELLITYYNNIAIAYDNINTKESLEKALLYLDKSTELIENFTEIDTPINNFTNDIAIGNIYNKNLIFNFNKAKKHYTRGLKNALELQDNLYITNSYINLSELYLKKKNDSTLYYIKEGLKYAAKEDSLYIINFSLTKSLYLADKEKYQEALENIQKTLSYGVDIDAKNWKTSPNKTNLAIANDKVYVLEALTKKAEILNKVYEQNPKDSVYLKVAINTIKSADDLIDIIQQNSIESKSKFLWRNEASTAYSTGLNSALLLNDEAASFYFMERNKAILLTESVIQNTEETKLPEELYKRGVALKKKTLHLEYLKQQATEADIKIADSLFNAKENYRNYVDSVRVTHPNYLKKTLNIKQITLDSIRKQLAPNTVLISYMWNTTEEEEEDNLYSLIADKNNSSLFKIEDVSELRTLLKRYKTLLSAPLKNKNDKKEYRTIAFNLYSKLFPTEEIRISIQDKTIVIVSDGELLNIPFESLITKKDTDNYLLMSNDISYAYSFSFLDHNNNRIRQAEHNFIGYASNSTLSDSLDILKNASKEVKTINSIISGDVILDENATKTHFLNRSNNAKIIHLATHADASKNPWIAFSDEKLNLYELYTYKNNADLVTLSACNTSIGEIANGEGALSLARGFFYSGANSVVASLWNANDKSTAFLMEAFYKNLNKGQTKTEALNNAKRYYLKKHSLSETSPYYWASFTLIGDYETVVIPSYTTHYIIVSLLICLGLIFFFRKKRKAQGSI